MVLAINAVMFIVEAMGGYLASSTALLSDSLDNLGDALTHCLSLCADVLQQPLEVGRWLGADRGGCSRQFRS